MAKNDFKKMFKKQIKDALLTDDKKERMDRVKSKTDEEEPAGSAPVEETKTSKPEPSKPAASKKKPGKKKVPAKKKPEAKAEPPKQDPKPEPKKDELVIDLGDMEKPAPETAATPAPKPAPKSAQEPKQQASAAKPAETGKTTSVKPVNSASAQAKKAAVQADEEDAATARKRDAANRDLYNEDEDAYDEDIQKNRYLTFVLNEEIYGISVGYVMEIIGVQKITEVPEMPDYIKGVINLRGQVVPIVDTRLRFLMPERDYDDRTCFIVVRESEKQVGLVVDRVDEVVDIPESECSPTPKVGRRSKELFIEKMGKLGDEVIMLLDMVRFLDRSKEAEFRKKATMNIGAEAPAATQETAQTEAVETEDAASESKE